MYVLPRVVDTELLHSRLNLDFIKFTNDLFYVTTVLKSPHNKIGVSVSGFMLGNLAGCHPVHAKGAWVAIVK
jgi:hypothetical protein